MGKELARYDKRMIKFNEMIESMGIPHYMQGAELTPFDALVPFHERHERHYYGYVPPAGQDTGNLRQASGLILKSRCPGLIDGETRACLCL